MRLTRTSSPTRSSKGAFQTTGFTLIELLVVVALIALIGLFAIPKVSNILRLSLNTATRELASTVKEAYNSAVVTGRVHRLAYDLEKDEFWVESGPGIILLDTAETAEREERRKRFAKESDQEQPSKFGIDKSITRKKVALPRGVSFEDVITEQSPDPIDEGVVYTHIFPHGLTEQTIIHLVDTSKHQLSLVISPIIGRTTLLPGYVKEEEVFGEED